LLRADETGNADAALLHAGEDVGDGFDACVRAQPALGDHAPREIAQRLRQVDRMIEKRRAVGIDVEI